MILTNVDFKPLFRTRSASSSGFGQDHHIDSYPDTEEDDSDSSDERGSIHTNATSKQQTRRKLPTTASSRVSGSSSPLVSPAGSRTFDEHVQKVPQPPNLNLEHLHDTLRKSLNKGSDFARTPANASPSGFDSEKMVCPIPKLYNTVYQVTFLFRLLCVEAFLQVVLKHTPNTRFVNMFLKCIICALLTTFCSFRYNRL